MHDGYVTSGAGWITLAMVNGSGAGKAPQRMELVRGFVVPQTVRHVHDRDVAAAGVPDRQPLPGSGFGVRELEAGANRVVAP